TAVLDYQISPLQTLAGVPATYDDPFESIGPQLSNLYRAYWYAQENLNLLEPVLSDAANLWQPYLTPASRKQVLAQTQTFEKFERQVHSVAKSCLDQAAKCSGGQVCDAKCDAPRKPPQALLPSVPAVVVSLHHNDVWLNRRCRAND